MQAERARAALLALAGLLACCARQPVPMAVTASPSPQASCRAGPDGSPVLADRGIGGTGGPTLTADRGIGGTGQAAKGTVLADRGIGGTGIVGVITGFGSICLAGEEVALPPGVPVAIGERQAGPDVLRAGQVAVVEASVDPVGLSARRVMVRFEVVGPVERVDGDTIRVAGQDVALSPQSWGVRPAVGDWVAVSGLRRADGVIVGTRVEPEPRGPVVVHGLLLEQAGSLRIGALPIRRDPATTSFVGTEVTVTGVIGADGALLPVSLVPDLLAIDPAAYFGPQVGVVFIEGFGVLEGGRLRLGPGFSVPASGLTLAGGERGVFRFERSGGALRATGFSAATPGFGGRLAPAPRFESAPMPNRAIGGPGGVRSGRGGFGGGGARGRFGRGQSQDAPSFAPPSSAPPSFAPSSGQAPGDGPPRGR